jgi:hypothetical protein
MGSLFSSHSSPSKHSSSTPAPPPPTAPTDLDWLGPDEPPKAKPSRSAKPAGRPFEADLDVCELDDRERPGHTWASRARSLSRSCLSFRSRRMCYTGRSLMVAVHLIDDEPVPLFGRVQACEYDGDGLYRVDLDLLPVPDSAPVKDWLAAHGHR